MFMSRHRITGQNHYIRLPTTSFENVITFKYMGATLTDQICIHEEIKSRLNSGNACYHAVQNLLSSRLLSKKVEIKIYETIMLPVFYEPSSVTLREQYRSRVFDNRVLRRIFGPKMDRVRGGWRRLHNELHNLYPSPDMIRVMKSRRMRWTEHGRDEKCLQNFCCKA
jgi:hypothetical protein